MHFLILALALTTAAAPLARRQESTLAPTFSGVEAELESEFASLGARELSVAGLESEIDDELATIDARQLNVAGLESELDNELASIGARQLSVAGLESVLGSTLDDTDLGETVRRGVAHDLATLEAELDSELASLGARQLNVAALESELDSELATIDARQLSVAGLEAELESTLDDADLGETVRRSISLDPSTLEAELDSELASVGARDFVSGSLASALESDIDSILAGSSPDPVERRRAVSTPAGVEDTVYGVEGVVNDTELGLDEAVPSSGAVAGVRGGAADIVSGAENGVNAEMENPASTSDLESDVVGGVQQAGSTVDDGLSLRH